MSKFAAFDLAQATDQVPGRFVVELTFAELCDAYESALPSDAIARLRKWREAFGDRGAWGIDRDTFARAAEAMTRAGDTPAKVNRNLSTIGGMYRWAHDVRKITPPNFRSPTRDIRRAREAMRVVIVTAEEEQRLRSLALATRDRRFGLSVALMLDTGARPGEILERKWEELDTELQEILLPEEVTKTGRARVLHFSATTAKLIERLRPPATERDRGVFVGRRGGVITFRKSWRALVEAIGRPDLHVYDMRHVAAARLLNSGVSVSVAAQILGLILHRRYGHLERGALKRAQEQAWGSATAADLESARGIRDRNLSCLHSATNRPAGRLFFHPSIELVRLNARSVVLEPRTRHFFAARRGLFIARRPLRFVRSGLSSVRSELTEGLRRNLMPFGA